MEILWCNKKRGQFKNRLKEIYRLESKITNVDISSLDKLSDGLINLLFCCQFYAKTTIISALERK